MLRSRGRRTLCTPPLPPTNAAFVDLVAKVRPTSCKALARRVTNLI